MTSNYAPQASCAATVAQLDVAQKQGKTLKTFVQRVNYRYPCRETAAGLRLVVNLNIFQRTPPTPLLLDVNRPADD